MLNKLIDKISYGSFILNVISIYCLSYTSEGVGFSHLFFGLSFVLMLLYILLHKHNFRLDRVWAYVFANIFWMGLSIIYCMDYDSSIPVFITVIQLYIFLILSYEFFKLRKNAFKEILYAIYIGSIVMGLYAISVYGFDGLISAFLYHQRIGTEINQINVFGMISGFGTLVGIYLYLLEHKIFYLSFLPITFIMAILSGSTKVLSILIIGFLFLFFEEVKKNKIFLLPIVIIASFLVGKIIVNIDDIEILKRFEQTLNIFTGQGVENGSTLLRFYMIQFGLSNFLDSPIFGYGLNSYSILFGNQTGWYVYSHNNYIEILVSGGIIGFVIYYSIYFNLFREIKLNDLSGRFVFSILFLDLILETANVSYYDKGRIIHLLLVLSYGFIKKDDSRNSIK